MTDIEPVCIPGWTIGFGPRQQRAGEATEIETITSFIGQECCLYQRRRRYSNRNFMLVRFPFFVSPSLSLSFYLSFSLSHSLYLSLHLSFSLSLSLSLYLPLSPSLSFFFSLYLSLYLSLSLSTSLFLFPSLFLSLSLF